MNGTPTSWTPGVTLFAIDPAHTHVEFAVRHLMISTVKGSFKKVEGTVRFDPSNPDATEAMVKIDPASVDTREPQRDAHLRSADFFDVEHFPEMRFVGRRVSGSIDEEFELVGDLTIRGESREVVLRVQAEGSGKDPWGNERAGFSAAAKIKRSVFGLIWNQALETGGVLVGDEVKISIDVELVKQPTPANV